jgi:enamine deaminase RidA (YjgF/YER057c/UK114 family)
VQHSVQENVQENVKENVQDMKQDADVETLLPVELGPAKIRYARGVRAGPWILATGQMAQDFATGIDPAALASGAPHYGVPRHEKEAARIYDNVAEVLRAGGAGIESVVRVDQYFTHHRAVDPYHVVRRGRLGTRIPPSTSIIVKSLLLPDAGIDLQAIALHPGVGAPEPLRHRDLDGPATSGYSPALRAGPFVFIAGAMASAKPGDPSQRGLALSARVPDGSLWKGQPIKLEAEYVITEKLKPALALAGCGLDDVVKAQIYLTHAEDAAAFNQVWNRHFAASPAAATVVACADPGLGLADARIEINAIALTKSAGGKTPITCKVDPPYDGHVVAVRAGDFLFLSGLMAADRNGLLPEAALDPRQPHFHAGASMQAKAILRNAQAICAAAGTSLANVVRIQQFHTDLREFYGAYAAWQDVLPGAALPISAVEVPGMTVPGCTLLMDLWVYAPVKK